MVVWRESLRSRSKHSTKALAVLPHNVAWPFLPLLPWCGRHVSAAMICGKKRPLTLNLALMLENMVLPDNVAPQIFLDRPENLWQKGLWEVSPYYASEMACARGKNHDIC